MMKAIEKRLKLLEEKINVSELPTLREYMDDYEDRYHDVNLNEILRRENKELHIGILHDLVARDEKIKQYQQNQKQVDSSIEVSGEIVEAY